MTRKVTTVRIADPKGRSQGENHPKEAKVEGVDPATEGLEETDLEEAEEGAGTSRESEQWARRTLSKKTNNLPSTQMTSGVPSGGSQTRIDARRRKD